MDLREVKNIHLIGIGGTGLSAIARVLLESGYQVSGSDRQISPFAEQIQKAGARVTAGHTARNVQGADLVIRSSAIPDDNPEVVEALRLGIPVWKRAELLGVLMQNKIGIGVAGTHGKTTTTAMIAWMMTALGLDPTYIVGGVSRNLGVNAHAGRGSHFVIEADEYDRMFLGLKPQTAVVTNIEHDHPDCYPTAKDFYQAFEQFARLLPAEGTLVICGDDSEAARLAEDMADRCRVVTYGIEAGSMRAVNPIPNRQGGYSFEANLGSRTLQVNLQVPGLHNVRNALAALVVGYLQNVDLDRAARALDDFSGTERRFDILGEAHQIVVIDDYGHHPTEIQVTLVAARARYPGQEVWAVWQPHTYSRTRTLLAAFAGAFNQADHVVVTSVYASREQPPTDGFSSQQVIEAMQHPDVHHIPDLQAAGTFLSERLKPGDVLIVFSAGDADQISRQVMNTLNQSGTLRKEQPHV
jgi:UDP-N-acetylmuramate--alanine ligase